MKFRNLLYLRYYTRKYICKKMSEAPDVPYQKRLLKEHIF